MVKDIHHVIKHAKFGDDRLRGSGVVAGQISAFPIDFVGRPYNTLTLPCERVMSRYGGELVGLLLLEVEWRDDGHDAGEIVDAERHRVLLVLLVLLLVLRGRR